jgi:hypothetical protein
MLLILLRGKSQTGTVEVASKWDNHVGAGQCSGWKGLRIEAI